MSDEEDPIEHFKNAVKEMVQAHEVLADEISRLKIGDDTGIIYYCNPKREPVWSGQGRINKMINNRVRRIEQLEHSIEEFCGIANLDKPILKNWSV